MKLSKLRVGEDYLVTGSRNWTETGGRRLRFAGNVTKGNRLAFDRGAVNVVVGVEMVQIGEDGEQLDSPALVVDLKDIKTEWIKGAAAVAATRAVMDNDERADLDERDRILSAALLVDLGEVEWIGRDHVKVDRHRLLVVLDFATNALHPAAVGAEIPRRPQ